MYTLLGAKIIIVGVRTNAFSLADTVKISA